jgi:hypothetical protein
MFGMEATSAFGDDDRGRRASYPTAIVVQWVSGGRLEAKFRKAKKKVYEGKEIGQSYPTMADHKPSLGIRGCEDKHPFAPPASALAQAQTACLSVDGHASVWQLANNGVPWHTPDFALGGRAEVTMR